MTDNIDMSEVTGNKSFDPSRWRGGVFRALRIEKQWSQTDVAAKMREYSIKPTASEVRNWEKGLCPSATRLRVILEIFEVEQSVLVY